MTQHPAEIHGPANAWHYTAHGFGHTSDTNREFIIFLQQKLPKIPTPDCIKVGNTGYWNRIEPINVQRYAQTTDETDRGMFFIGDNVLMMRYLKGDTIIWYNRDGNWSHNVSSQEDIIRWQQKVQNI